MLWAGEEASPAGVELSCSLEKIAHQNQGERDRECRGWLPREVSLPCLFSAVSLAQFEFRLGFLAWCGVMFWVSDLGVEPGTTAHSLPKTAQDAE